MEPEDPAKCRTRIRMEEAVQTWLLELAELSRAEADLVTTDNTEKILTNDKRIENVVGEKERALGALQQHRAEHGC